MKSARRARIATLAAALLAAGSVCPCARADLLVGRCPESGPQSPATVARGLDGFVEASAPEQETGAPADELTNAEVALSVLLIGELSPPKQPPVIGSNPLPLGPIPPMIGSSGGGGGGGGGPPGTGGGGGTPPVMPPMTPPQTPPQDAPEPATLITALLGSGLVGLYAARRRKKSAD